MTEIEANNDISDHDEGNISESSGDFDISSLLSKQLEQDS